MFLPAVKQPYPTFVSFAHECKGEIKLKSNISDNYTKTGTNSLFETLSQFHEKNLLFFSVSY